MSDSIIDTTQHQLNVIQLMARVCILLEKRAQCHDNSKLSTPEKESFDKHKDIYNCEFNSIEYKRHEEDMKYALDHHYRYNRHHIEHFDRVSDMNLIDIIEMLCDMCDAVKRTPNGNIKKSIDILSEKHSITQQLKRILLNTVEIINVKKD